MSAEHKTPFRKLQETRGLTNREIAVAAELGEARVSDIRRGLVPGKATQERLIAVLGLSESEIAELGWGQEVVGA